MLANAKKMVCKDKLPLFNTSIKKSNVKKKKRGT